MYIPLNFGSQVNITLFLGFFNFLFQGGRKGAGGGSHSTAREWWGGRGIKLSSPRTL